MDSFYIICFVLFFLPTLVFLYFTVVRKNAFEERLALFRPTHKLSQKREAYRQQVRKNHTLSDFLPPSMCFYSNIAQRRI